MAAIAFVCAMPMEIVPLVKKLSLSKDTVGDLPVRRGTLAGRDVVAIVTGMGTEFARHGTTRLLDAMPVAHVVSVGITGAVDNETAIGTLILPEVVVNGDTGTEHRPALLGSGTPRGRMWTSDTFNTDLDEIARIRATGVVSLDMETAAIAAVCEARGIPWSVFRVISDRATDGQLDEESFGLINQDGSPNPKAIVRYFARHPGRIPSMVKLANGARRAAFTAADTAIRAVSHP